MTIREHIEKFIEQNNAVLDFLDSIPSYMLDESSSPNFVNEDLLIPKFLKILKESNYNPTLGVNFLITLRLLNNPKFYKQFDFFDLQNLFKSLIELQPYELDMYVEAAHFEWVIMDNEKKAKEIIKSGIEKAKEKITELEKLNEEINDSVA